MVKLSKNNLKNLTLWTSWAGRFRIVIAFFLLANCANAQLIDPHWGFYHYKEPNNIPTPDDHFRLSNTCLTGLGGFNDDALFSTLQTPKRLFHLYANILVPGRPGMQFEPAFLRIQSNQGMTQSGIIRPLFSQTGIEFFVGRVDDPSVNTDDNQEEHISTLRTFEFPIGTMSNVFGNYNPRGLDILSMKPGTNGLSNQVLNMRFLTAEILDDNNQIVSVPRIGIGTTTPRELLQLGQRFTFHSQSGDAIWHNVYYDTRDKKGKRILNGPAAGIGFWEGIITIGAVPGQVANTEVQFNNWDPQVNTVEGISVVPVIGGTRIGMGVAYPGSRLDLRGLGNNGSTSALRIQNTDNTTLMQVFDHGAIGVGTTSPGAKLHIKTSGYQGGTSALNIDNSQDSRILTVLDNGRIGIGTSTPQKALHVIGDVQIGQQWNSTTITGYNNRVSIDGVVLAREMRVSAVNWADFVFEKEYRLPALEEVEQHIVSKGHLPGIPTEKEVKENGVNVAEVQSKLLQKIEELTLYVINLEKKNKELNSRIYKLEEKQR